MKVGQKEDIILVTWELTTTCNFACSYCQDYLHNGKYKWPSSVMEDNMIKLLHEINKKGKPIALDIVGGEPSLWPGCIKWLKRIREEIPDIILFLISNGSRTIRWWKEIKHHVDEINFSFHPEFADSNHLIDVINEVSDTVAYTLHILTKPEEFNKCVNFYYNAIEKLHTPMVSFKVVIDYRFGVAFENYTWQQKEIINNVYTRSKYRPKTWKPYRITDKILIGNKEYLWKEILINNLHEWKGFKCWIGINRFYINSRGDILAGSCGYNKVPGYEEPLGSLKNTWKLPTNPLICPLERCLCKADALIRKEG